MWMGLRLNWRAICCKAMDSVKIKQNAEKTEKIIADINTAIDSLNAVSGKRDEAQLESERLKLSSNNDELRMEIKKLKFILENLKLQTGGKSVSLPKQTTPVNVGNNEPKVPDIKQIVKKEKPKASKPQELPAQTAGKEGKIDVSRLDLRVGKIVSVEKHPNAESLYVEKVDVGEDQPRTILSGLVKFVTMEELQDKLAIFLCNLKPAKMRGILSEGMIMCASTPENVKPLLPPPGAEIGDRIECSGFVGEPDKQLNPKRKVWEQVQPDLSVDPHGVANYKGTPLMIKIKGIVTSPVVKDCAIK